MSGNDGKSPRENRGMKILMLGPERVAMKSALESFGDTVSFMEEKITPGCEPAKCADFLISYGYRHIIGQKVLDLFRRCAINLHISYLPWNRGSDPNLWSFLEDTPKGVTIHYLDRGLDTGDILVRKEIVHRPDDTLRSSYNRLAEAIELLLMQVWSDIRAGKHPASPQPPGGTSHRLSERDRFAHLLSKGWDTPVADLNGRALETEPRRQL